MLRKLWQFTRKNRQSRRETKRQLTHESLENRSLLAVVPVGSEIVLHDLNATGQRVVQDSNAVALGADAELITALHGRGPSDRDGVFVRMTDPNGAEMLATTLVNQTVHGKQESPNIASDVAGNFVVAWSGRGSGDRHGVYARRFDASGNALSDEFLVNTDVGGAQLEPSVSMAADGRFAVSWHGVGSDDFDGVFLRRYDASGNAQGSAVRVNTTTTGEQSQADVAIDDDGNVVVAWSSRDQDGDDWGVFGQQFSSNGATVGSEFSVNSSTGASQYLPTVDAESDGDFVVAWSSFDVDRASWEVKAQRFMANGTEAGGEIDVNPIETAHQTNVEVATAANQFVVAWNRIAADGSGSEVLAQVYDATGATDGDEILVNADSSGFDSGNQLAPSIDFDARGDLVVTWTGDGTARKSTGFGKAFVEDGPEVNVAPVLGAVANSQAIVGIETTVPVTATDGNPTDTLTYTLDPTVSPRIRHDWQSRQQHGNSELHTCRRGTRHRKLPRHCNGQR